MARKLQKLTAAQEARFAEFDERWAAIGLCTQPADRERAEAAIRDAYRMGGRTPPERVVWCGSPVGEALTLASVSESVGASVSESVWGSVWASVSELVSESVWGSVSELVSESVWGSVSESVRELVSESVWASVWASVSESGWGYGQHDAAWLVFYSFFREACDLRSQMDRLVPLNELAESAGWWLPHERVCWVSERHHVCRLDGEQRLHADGGPAVAYPDGWAIWAWHGVRVPQKVVEAPHTLTAEEILAERNVEVRRVMIERFGYDRLLAETNATPRSEDDYGKLWSIKVAGDEPVVLVEVVNSTAEPDGGFRDYILRVPPTVRTAREAVAWTFDVPESEYVPKVET